MYLSGMEAYEFLFSSGTIPVGKNNQQVLDRLQVERERGITVKAQTASLFHSYKGKTFLLNLIDTPVSQKDASYFTLKISSVIHTYISTVYK